MGRGFTGHEHFFEVSLIHMNGRMGVYPERSRRDAQLGRFLSPDNYIQDPYNTQNFNRYGYVYNNPLMYNDPSGKFFWFAVAAGALIGGVSAAIQGGGFGDILAGALIGGIAGGIGAGVGNLASGVGGFFGSGALSVTGFWSGAAVGAAGGFAGGFIGGAGNAWVNGSNFGDGIVAGIKGGAFGGVAGGIIGGTVVSSAGLMLKDATIGRWLDNAIVKPIREIGRSFKRLFGGGKEDAAPVEYANYQGLSSDPLAGSSMTTPVEYFNAGGANSGGLGVSKSFTLDELYGQEKPDFSSFWGKVNYFWTGGNVGKLRYNRDGKVLGFAPLGGTAGDFIGARSSFNLIKWAKSIGQVFRSGGSMAKNATKTSTSLGAARSSVRSYLKNVRNVPRNQLVKDLEVAGFKKVFDGRGMQHFQRGKWKIRLDPPQSGTPFNHMHINRGGNKNTFDIFLNPVNYKSPGAHILIK